MPVSRDQCAEYDKLYSNPDERRTIKGSDIMDTCPSMLVDTSFVFYLFVQERVTQCACVHVSAC